MLPENLASSYQYYKAATNTVVSWLNSTAIACGFTAPTTVIKENDSTQTGKPTTTTRLKGKARMEAKAKIESNKSAKLEARQIITTQQLLKQVSASKRKDNRNIGESRPGSQGNHAIARSIIVLSSTACLFMT